MPPDPNVQVGVAGWVQREADGALLMLCRRGRQAYADGRGKWSVPGGWLEAGEDPLRAAEREVLEETGVVVRAIEPYGYVLAPDDLGKRTIVTFFIRCRYVSGEPHETEPEKCGSPMFVAEDVVRYQDLFRPLAMFLEQRPHLCRDHGPF